MSPGSHASIRRPFLIGAEVMTPIPVFVGASRRCEFIAACSRLCGATLLWRGARRGDFRCAAGSASLQRARELDFVTNELALPDDFQVRAADVARQGEGDLITA